MLEWLMFILVWLVIWTMFCYVNHAIKFAGYERFPIPWWLCPVCMWEKVRGE